MPIQVAQGVVDIEADVDYNDIRRTARRVAQFAAEAADNEGRRRRGSFWRTLFTPNPRIMQALSRPIATAFGSPIGLAALILGGMFVAAFVAAVIAGLALASLPVAFAGLAGVLLMKLGGSFDDYFQLTVSLEKAHLKLENTIADSTAEFRKGARVLNYTTAAGRKNLEAVFDQIEAYRDVYDAQVASGVAMSEAARQYNEHIEQLKRTLYALGYNKKAVDELLNKYKQVPTFIDVVNDSLAKLKKNLIKSAEWLIPSFLGALDVAESQFKTKIGPALNSVFADIGKYISPMTVAITEGVALLLQGIHRALDNEAFGMFMNSFTASIPRLFKAIGDFFEYLSHYSDLIGEAFEIATSVVDNLLQFLARVLVVGSGMLIVFADLWHGAENAGSAIATAWHNVSSAFTGVLDAMQLMAAATTSGEQEAAHAQLTASVLALWSNFRVLLSAIWDELWAHIKSVWASTVSPWLKSQMAALLDYLIALAIAKLGVLRDQMVAKIKQGIADFIASLAKLPIQAAATIAGLGPMMGSVLAGVAAQMFPSGAAIVSNLISGLMSKIPSLRSAVSQIAGMIAGFLPGSPVKTGPLRSLNHGYAGGQIIKMVTSGMERQLNKLEAMAHGMGSNFDAGFGMRLAAGYAGGGGERNVNQTINVYTHEIDPRKNSAELGFELFKVM